MSVQYLVSCMSPFKNLYLAGVLKKRFLTSIVVPVARAAFVILLGCKASNTYLTAYSLSAVFVVIVTFATDAMLVMLRHENPWK